MLKIWHSPLSEHEKKHWKYDVCQENPYTQKFQNFHFLILLPAISVSVNVITLPNRRRKIFSTENMITIRYNNEIMHSTENTVFGRETPSTKKTVLHSKYGILMTNTHRWKHHLIMKRQSMNRYHVTGLPCRQKIICSTQSTVYINK